MSQQYVEADPYPWPYNGDLRAENTVFPVIDMHLRGDWSLDHEASL
jgi:hypothetical protein